MTESFRRCKMKKLITIITLLGFVLGLAACGGTVKGAIYGTGNYTASETEIVAQENAMLCFAKDLTLSNGDSELTFLSGQAIKATKLLTISFESGTLTGPFELGACPLAQTQSVTPDPAAQPTPDPNAQPTPDPNAAATPDPNAALTCPPNDGEADFIVCIATPGKGTKTIADLTAQGRILIEDCNTTPAVMTHQGLWSRDNGYLAHTASTKPEEITADGSYAGWRCGQ